MQNSFKTEETTQQVNESDSISKEMNNIQKKISKHHHNINQPRIGSDYQAKIITSPIHSSKCKRNFETLKVWDGSSKKHLKLEVERERKRLRYLMGREFTQEDTILTMFFMYNFDRDKVNKALNLKKEAIQTKILL
ncbi:unnamed protein product [Paramecium sonneborni]|uniref:Uncharacterized protein n=1 Tax=Paramecium sonneborni TaxID=65129 RepID=A0A8S1PXM8_9CILI|nr:unnamed protein product [Paramecium sonneborni]